MSRKVKEHVRIPHWVDDADDFLATHVCMHRGRPRGMVRLPNTDELWPVPLVEKARLELQFWQERLVALWNGIDRREAGRASVSTHDRLGPEALARTYRILKGLSALYFPDAPDIPAVIADSCASWRREYTALNEALTWGETTDPETAPVVSRILPQSFDRGERAWSLSLGLLTIRAAAWSQVKWEDQPYHWEAHSALCARQEHVNKGTLSEIELSMLTFLIRHQSAPGHWSRTTGDERFCRAFDRLSESSRLEDKHLFALLGILAHAQEFRNWTIESEVPAQLRRLYQDGGYRRNPGPTDFRHFWEIDPSLQQVPGTQNAATGFHQRYTWSYVQSLLEDEPEAVNRFRRVAEDAVLNAVMGQDASREPVPVTQITTFALDRESLALPQLRAAVMEQIRKVHHQADFHQFFKWKPERVPSESGDPGTYEYAIVVRLKDHITARHMVFAGGDSDELENDVSPAVPAQDYCRRMYLTDAALQPIAKSLAANGASDGASADREPLPQRVLRRLTGLNGKGLSREELGRRTYEQFFGRPLSEPAEGSHEPTAWEIYESLFLRGVLSGFISWAAGDALPYCPTHLIRRFLKVSYRLRGSCVELPIEFGDRREVMTLPRPPRGVDRKAPAIRAIARMVCAYQVNKMMATAATHLKVGLRKFSSSPVEQFWREAVLDEYRENSFEELLGKYVDNYHRLPRYVESDGELLPRASFLATRTSRPDAMLKDLLEGPDGKQSVVVVGVDIGAGSIKFGFFELRMERGTVKPRPWLAPPAGPGKPPRSRDFRIPTENSDRPYADAHEFCERLLSEMERRLKASGASLENIAALGIAWPGPVREGVVRDWSGILRNFISHRDPGAELTALLSLDICGSLSQLLSARGLSEIAVVMMNDGDSHAIGELTKLALSGAAPDFGTQVVLKAGSGIAGAVVSRGELLAGLMEFGKILMNLAYTPSVTYPNGLASGYFSGRTLPMLAQHAMPHLSGLLPGITSIEVGTLAELADDPDDTPAERTAEATRRLVIECGKVAFAHRLREKIDPAELTELLTDDGWSEQSQLRQAIEMHLGKFGTEARQVFRHQVTNYGRIRLEAILQLEPELHDEFVAAVPDEAPPADADQPTDAPQRLQVLNRIRTAAHTARKCAERLGEFLGDLVILLYDEYQMDRALVAGGVISEKTREIVLSAASARLGKFSGLPLATIDNSIIRLDPKLRRLGVAAPEDRPARVSGPNAPMAAEFAAFDSGTLGSAVQAGLERLKRIRLQGLNRLHAMVYNLSYTEELIVERHRIRVSAMVGSSPDSSLPRDEFPLAEYALKYNQVRKYLDDNQHELGIIKSTETVADGEEIRTTYTRWLPT